MASGGSKNTRVLSIDVGSSSVRAGLYDGSGADVEGTEVKLDEKKYTLVREDDILGVIA